MIKEIVIVTIVLLLTFGVGIEIILTVYGTWEMNCDIKYGHDNWTIKETTGSGKCRFYIGQCWECVLK